MGMNFTFYNYTVSTKKYRIIPTSDIEKINKYFFIISFIIELFFRYNDGVTLINTIPQNRSTKLTTKSCVSTRDNQKDLISLTFNYEHEQRIQEHSKFPQ